MHVTITTPPVERIVTVEMSEAEAETLRILCEHTGGAPNHSRRKHTDALNKALYDADIQYRGDQVTGSTYFKTEEV